MYKIFKKNNIIVLFLCIWVCVFISFFSASAMENDIQPMELSEETVFTQLMEASFKNDIEKVKSLFCSYQIEPNVCPSSWGINPLSWAAYHGNVELAKLLLKNNFGIISQGSACPVHVAVQHKKVDVLRLLLTFSYFIPKQPDIASIKQNLHRRINECGGFNGVISEVPPRALLQELYSQQYRDRICFKIKNISSQKYTDNSGMVPCLTFTAEDQYGLEDYANKLAKSQFECIQKILASSEIIYYVSQTPYQIAVEQNDTQCSELIKPEGLKDRLCPLIRESYLLALKEMLQEIK